MPVTVTLAVPLPLMAAKPAVWVTVIVAALPALSVSDSICVGSPPVNVMALPLAVEKTSAALRLADWAAATWTVTVGQNH